MAKLLTACLVACLATAMWAADATQTIHSSTSQQKKEIVLSDGTTIEVEATHDVKLKATAPAQPRQRRMAIFVQNNAGKAFDPLVNTLRNQISALATSEQIEIIDAEETVKAIAALPEYNESRENKSEGFWKRVFRGTEDKKVLEKKTADGRNTTLDEKLLANTSRARLAENMNADYMLSISLDKLSKNRMRLNDKRFDGPMVREVYQISGTYKVIDVYSGGSIGGGVLRASKSYMQSQNLEIDVGNFADHIEEQLAEKVAADIQEKEPQWREASLAKSGIEVIFNAQAFDMNNQPIYLPLYDGTKLVNERAPAGLAATVEVDGIAKGSAACTVRLSQGIHKVRFFRTGYQDVTLHIAPREGLAVSVNMAMTEGEYERNKDMLRFMNDLTKDREISQAKAEKLRGEAQRLRQSGIRIDAKELPEEVVNLVR